MIDEDTSRGRALVHLPSRLVVVDESEDSLFDELTQTRTINDMT